MWAVPRCYMEDKWGNWVGWKPASNEISVEAEESPPLEAITKEWLVNTQQAGKNLVHAVVICKVWSLAIAL
jgi:hypothetical protein